MTLPAAPTRFVGRRRELQELADRVTTSRLVTLTGAAGCGKTRLALQVAADLRPRFPDGVYWLDLTALSDPGLVARALARAVGAAEQPDRSLTDAILDRLRDKSVLLVLDNCEHLLSACADLGRAVLSAPGVSLLATSREPLGVTGELRYPVSPLALPPAGLPASEVGRFEAIQLFVERVRAALPGWVLSPDNALAVSWICRQLDGIPLALELAAARVNVLTVEQIAALLRDRTDLLALPADPAPRHHRSLRAALDWSYDLLTPPEQRLLQRLSVFVGGCSLAGVETVGGDEGAGQAHLIDLVSSLVVKSLVIADTLHRREARYSLLETIRRYAREKLAADGSEPEVRNRHLDWFLRLAEETAPKLGGPYQHLWLSWLDEEVENLRAALAWSLETGSIERGLRMAVAVYQYWTIRDLAEEGLGWIERLLARADDRVPRALRANALAYGAFLAGFRGQAAAQIRYGAEAAALVEAAGMEGKPALRWALAAQADAARASGDYQTEFSLGERVIRLNRELADRQQLGLTLSIYSFSAMAIGRYDAARAMLDEALPLLREAGNPYRIAMALNFSGDLARCERSWAQAEGVYRESIALLRELGAVRDLASALHNLGHARLHLGDVEGALGLFRESLALHLGQQNRPGMAECLIGFAAVAIAQGQPSAGARLLAAVVAVGGPAAASAWAATRLEYDGCLALARAALPPDELQAELAAGSRFSQEQAVDLAQGLALTTPAMLHSRVRADPLTRREREVAGWIAQGKTNGEIAEGLVLSKRTVEKHIANILSKLGLTNRAQIVRWAIESGAASDRAIPQAER